MESFHFSRQQARTTTKKPARMQTIQMSQRKRPRPTWMTAQRRMMTTSQLKRRRKICRRKKTIWIKKAMEPSLSPLRLSRIDDDVEAAASQEDSSSDDDS